MEWGLRGRFLKEGSYVYLMVDSPCCMAESNTIVIQLSSNQKLKKVILLQLISGSVLPVFL